MGRMEERRWERFVKQGGPSRIDRLTLNQPFLVGLGMVLLIGVMYLLVGRAFFGSEIDQARLVDAMLYSVIFTAVWLVLTRRTLDDAVKQWDAQADDDLMEGTVEGDHDDR